MEKDEKELIIELMNIINEQDKRIKKLEEDVMILYLNVKEEK